MGAQRITPLHNDTFKTPITVEGSLSLQDDLTFVTPPSPAAPSFTPLDDPFPTGKTMLYGLAYLMMDASNTPVSTNGITTGPGYNAVWIVSSWDEWVNGSQQVEQIYLLRSDDNGASWRVLTQGTPADFSYGQIYYTDTANDISTNATYDAPTYPPAPDAAPWGVESPDTWGSVDGYSTQEYAVTYVNANGGEGPLSYSGYGSNYDHGAILVTFADTPPTEANIVARRLYRYDNCNWTGWRLLTQVSLDTPSYTDTESSYNLQWCQGFAPPASPAYQPSVNFVSGAAANVYVVARNADGLLSAPSASQSIALQPNGWGTLTLSHPAPWMVSSYLLYNASNQGLIAEVTAAEADAPVACDLSGGGDTANAYPGGPTTKPHAIKSGAATPVRINEQGQLEVTTTLALTGLTPIKVADANAATVANLSAEKWNGEALFRQAQRPADKNVLYWNSGLNQWTWGVPPGVLSAPALKVVYGPGVGNNELWVATDGIRVGTSNSSMVSFFGASPQVRPLAGDDLLAALQRRGLLGTGRFNLDLKEYGRFKASTLALYAVTVQWTANNGTYTCDTDRYGLFNIGVAANMTLTLSGTPDDGQTVVLRLAFGSDWIVTFDSAKFAWGTDITEAMIPMTAGSKREIGLRYCAADSKWRVAALNRGF